MSIYHTYNFHPYFEHIPKCTLARVGRMQCAHHTHACAAQPLGIGSAICSPHAHTHTHSQKYPSVSSQALSIELESVSRRATTALAHYPQFVASVSARLMLLGYPTNATYTPATTASKRLHQNTREKYARCAHAAFHGQAKRTGVSSSSRVTRLKEGTSETCAWCGARQQKSDASAQPASKRA